MNNKNNSVLCILLFLGALGMATPAMAEIAIIAHPGNPLDKISRDEVARIYLGKTRNFPSGEAVHAVDQIAGTEIRSDFYRKVVDKQESRLKVYWARLMFTGKGRPPKAIGDDSAVKTYIAEHENALGYVDIKSVDRSVKVLLIVP